MTNSNESSIEDRKVERKTLKQRARALFRSPSSYYPASHNKKKTKSDAKEMAVHRKMSFMQELQESASIELDLKDSTPLTPLTSNWAIKVAQHAEQQPYDSSMVQVAVLTLVLVVFLIRAATYHRQQNKSRDSKGKRDFDQTVKTLHDVHNISVNDTASKGEQKKSLQSDLRVTAEGEEEQYGHNVLNVPSHHVSSDEEKAKNLPPQLIFEVAGSGIETTEQSHKEDCSSSGSTTASTVFTISTTGEAEDDDNCSIDTETAGDSSKMDSYLTAPPKVQRVERNLTEDSKPNVTNVCATSINKKRSILKKTLDVSTENDEESAEFGKDMQGFVGVAMKIAVAVVAVNMLVLIRRR